MQNQNIGGYKIFKFKENAKFYFLSKPDRALQNRTHEKPRREMYSFCLIFLDVTWLSDIQIKKGQVESKCTGMAGDA